MSALVLTGGLSTFRITCHILWESVRFKMDLHDVACGKYVQIEA